MTSEFILQAHLSSRFPQSLSCALEAKTRTVLKVVIITEAGSCYATQFGFELLVQVILLLQSPQQLGLQVCTTIPAWPQSCSLLLEG
jgi:hypothetical protein